MIRRRGPWLLIIPTLIATQLVVQACSSFEPGDTPSTPSSSDGSTDAGSTIDGFSASDSGSSGDVTTTPKCDAATPFTSPLHVLGLNDVGLADYSAHLSPDERVIVFARQPIAPTGVGYHLFQAERPNKDDVFGMPVQLTTLSSPFGADTDYFATFSPSFDTVYFASTRDPSGGVPGFGVTRLYKATREGNAFSVPTVVDGDGGTNRNHPHLARHAPELWMSATVASNESEIFRRTISSNVVGEPELVSTVSSGKSQIAPVLSDDGLVLYWGTNRVDGEAKGAFDVWVATRATTQDSFSVLGVHAVAEVNSANSDWPVWLSPDQCRLYFHSERNSALRLWVASRSPQ